jgi:phosphoserine phosphatase RsbU/P
MADSPGGDFYDIFELPGQRLGLLIADVSDKGIPAAMFMALTRTLIRAVVLEEQHPAEVMRRVNSLIIPDNREEMFVTAVFGVISLKTGEFTYANAGHNPPLKSVNERNEVEVLSRTGAALGIIENLEIEARTISIRPGETLLFYTDGLTEAFSPHEETFGTEKLEELMTSGSELAPRSLLDMLEDALKQFTGPLPASDDLTMLAIRRNPA